MLAAEHGIDKVRGGSFCTTVLPEAEAKVLAKMVDSAGGTCFRCHQRGHVTNECPVTLPMAARRDQDWDCPDCGDRQFGRNKECRECGKWRPKEYTPVATPTGHKKGDWICQKCHDHQFAKNDICRKCKAPKPAVTLAAPLPSMATPAEPTALKRPSPPASPDEPAHVAKKPRIEESTQHDVVRKGDWECSSCSVNNYASRTSCFRCKKVKPAADAPTVATCVICLDKPACITLIPCGHMAMCRECTIRESDTCPMCRTPVTARQVTWQ